MSILSEHFCSICGTELETQYNDTENRYVPYCSMCGEYRFPSFDCAVVMIIFNESKDRTLMINQFNDKKFYFVSGYIDKGESAEEAVKRELHEEVGLDVISEGYIGSHYYEPSNTLMFGYWVTVDDNIQPVTNEEVDDYKWLNIAEDIPMHPLAEIFVNKYFEK